MSWTYSERINKVESCFVFVFVFVFVFFFFFLLSEDQREAGLYRDRYFLRAIGAKYRVRGKSDPHQGGTEFLPPSNTSF